MRICLMHTYLQIIHTYICVIYKANMAKCWKSLNLGRRHTHCTVFENFLRLEIFSIKRWGENNFCFREEVVEKNVELLSSCLWENGILLLLNKAELDGNSPLKTSVRSIICYVSLIQRVLNSEILEQRNDWCGISQSFSFVSTILTFSCCESPAHRIVVRINEIMYVQVLCKLWKQRLQVSLCLGCNLCWIVTPSVLFYQCMEYAFVGRQTWDQGLY